MHHTSISRVTIKDVAISLPQNIRGNDITARSCLQSNRVEALLTATGRVMYTPLVQGSINTVCTLSWSQRKTVMTAFLRPGYNFLGWA